MPTGVRLSSDDPRQAVGHGVADVLEVGRAAADDDAEGDDRVVVRGQGLDDDGQLDGAGDADDGRAPRRRTRARVRRAPTRAARR